MKEQHDEQ
ncbi:hypothetical protein SS209_00698 [Salmonella enterica subsp. enterica serovar Senftenberg str. SS209]|nr:hypothetical protein SS209_00698 [Salmonella enterica subsp. enterica serovar Senftenberg str. SS209]